MSALERRIDRLLQWYPTPWRAAHGDVLRSTLLDHAEAEQRTRLHADEAWSIRLNGFGERLTLSAAAWFAVAALLVALCSTLITFSAAGPEWVFLAAAAVAPMLLSAALLSVPRALRLLRSAPTVIALLLTCLAWAAAGAARWSWSVGFDEADAGLAPSPLSAAFVPFALTAWAVGGAAVAVAVLGIGERLPRGLRWAAGLLAAIVVPPAAGLAALSPATTALLAGTTAIGCMIAVARTRPADRSAGARVPVPTPVRRGITPFAALALLVAVAGLAVAFSAHLWLPGVDGTRAMQLGTVVGTVAALPLLGAIAWILVAHLPGRRVEVAAGTALAAAGLLISAVLTSSGVTASGDLPWGALIPVALGGGMLGSSALPLRRELRLACAVLLGAALCFPAWAVIAMPMFLVPLPALAMLLWGATSRRRRASSMPLKTA